MSKAKEMNKFEAIEWLEKGFLQVQEHKKDTTHPDYIAIKRIIDDLKLADRDNMEFAQEVCEMKLKIVHLKKKLIRANKVIDLITEKVKTADELEISEIIEGKQTVTKKYILNVEE